MNLLLIAALISLAPVLLPLVHGTEGAWQYVVDGVAAALAWGLLATRSTGLTCAAAAFLAVEGLERAGCRMAWPMTGKPQTGGMSLCEAAIGLPDEWLSLLALLIAVAIAQEGVGHGRPPGGS